MLHIFEDSEAVIKMIIQGRSPCPEPTESHLIGCLTESIRTPKIQIQYVDAENQLADLLTKGNFTRDEWTHFSPVD